MNQNLEELLQLYDALQVCALADQAARREAFSAKVKEVAAALSQDHWRIAAYVQREWDRQCRSENKRCGVDRGRGLPPLADG